LNTVSKTLWGMVHVGALPGTPHSINNWDQVIEKAVEEAVLLERSGFTGVLFENMHDVPYLKSNVGPEVVAFMSVIGTEIKKQTQLSLGLQILAGANEEALAVAQAIDADWIRVEGFVFAHVADEGLFDACAGKLLRLRKEWGAEKVKIMADIKKKHASHGITQDVSIGETARAAEFFGADAVIVTGSSTGEVASVGELEEVKKSISIPVFIGSGINPENLKSYQEADGFIVGSFLKEKGNWQNPILDNASSQIVRAFKSL